MLTFLLSILFIQLLMCDLGSSQTSNVTACYELQKQGKNETTTPRVSPFGSTGRPVDLSCDFITDGGGWTVIQKRDPGGRKTEFYQNWAAYEQGFGNVTTGSNFWLGLSIIHALTEFGPMELLINLTDWTGDSSYAMYREFSVGNSSDFYRLQIDGYNGNATDSLTQHNGQQFSTFDMDHDNAPSNCALIRHGGWWYNACYYSNLNGYYYNEGEKVGDREDGVSWNTWKGPFVSMKSTEMKVRPRKP